MKTTQPLLGTGQKRCLVRFLHALALSVHCTVVYARAVDSCRLVLPCKSPLWQTHAFCHGFVDIPALCPVSGTDAALSCVSPQRPSEETLVLWDQDS